MGEEITYIIVSKIFDASEDFRGIFVYKIDVTSDNLRIVLCTRRKI